MKPVSVSDYYQCQRCYGSASIDIASLTDFYLPLLGSKSYATYLALTREDSSAHKHEDILLCLDLSPGEFEASIARLEAVGLVRTFIAKEDGYKLLLYCLMAPLHGQEFSSDIMLSGTVKGKIGIELFDRLYSRHQGEDTPWDMEEVSASFPEIFKPKYDPKFYLSAQEKKSFSGKARAKTGFDKELFERKMLELGIRKGAFSESELNDVEKIGTMFSLSESRMAEFVAGAIQYNAPVGKKLDTNLLLRQVDAASSFGYLREEKGEKSKIDSNSMLAQKVRMMDEMPPVRFLTLLQNNHSPASSDVKLIERLTIKIGLPAPCTNVLIDWVLQTKNNELPAPYTEKIAAAMVRAGCRSARDAMDYLFRSSESKKQFVSEKTNKTINTPTVVEEHKKTEDNMPEEMTEEEYQAILDDYYKWKDGKTKN